MKAILSVIVPCPTEDVQVELARAVWVQQRDGLIALPAVERLACPPPRADVHERIVERRGGIPSPDILMAEVVDVTATTYKIAQSAHSNDVAMTM